MNIAKKRTERFKVGDWVVFPYGSRNLFAQVIEARGPLGINGRRLYRVRVVREAGEPDAFEMPEDDMQPASPPDKSSIMRYLKDGGLVEILRSNIGGGHDQPKAWLTYTPRGGIVHTFVAERGMTGGAPVPFYALLGDRVFAGKDQDVVGFLGSFGLNRAEAEEIVSAVGTAP